MTINYDGFKHQFCSYSTFFHYYENPLGSQQVVFPPFYNFSFKMCGSFIFNLLKKVKLLLKNLQILIRTFFFFLNTLHLFLFPLKFFLHLEVFINWIFFFLLFTLLSENITVKISVGMLEPYL